MKIKRIVKLTFREDTVETFLTIFENSKERIRQFEGCQHLELWRDVRQQNVFFTYSFWDSEVALNNYRYSDLFRATWAKTKVLFDAKPEAWSIEVQAIVE